MSLWSIRRASERGTTQLGWLHSQHTFSFGDYWDAAYLGYGALRVINEDRLAAGAGFPPHAHREMEIISYVLSGALQHRDSMGNGSIILPGQVQYMSAGSGLSHSEYNALQDEATHFYQIWIVPNVRGGAPRYAQYTMESADHSQRFGLIASGPGSSAPIELRQDAHLARAWLSAGSALDQPLAAGRQHWLQVLRGTVNARNPAELTSQGSDLDAGDGLALAHCPGLSLHARSETELLLFDLPTFA